jgi:hypothetical protein
MCGTLAFWDAFYDAFDDAIYDRDVPRSLGTQT